MQTLGKKSERRDPREGDDRRELGETKSRRKGVGAGWRPRIRSLHRDAGYLAVGLTVIYAASGLAVNHIPRWDPSFVNFETTHELGPGLPQGDDELAAAVRAKLGIREEPREVYRAAPDRVDVLFDQRTLHVNPITGQVFDAGQKPRFFLRLANWLHLNRGKKAWTFIADTYAVALLFLATSGMLMIPGRRGFFWRGAVMVAIGAAIPVIYVTSSGGP